MEIEKIKANLAANILKKRKTDKKKGKIPARKDRSLLSQG